MSLIQDALRRKQQEEQGVPRAPSEIHAPAPARFAAGPADDPRRRSSSTGLFVLRLICYAVILLGALAGLFSLFRTTTRPEPSAQIVQAPAAVAPAEVPAPAPPAPIQAVVPAPAVVAQSAPAPAPVVPPPPKRGPDEWPYVKLTGVLTRPHPEDSSAVLNGEMVEVDNSVAGVRLLEVRANGVLLRWRNQEQFIKIGRNTEPAVTE